MSSTRTEHGTFDRSAASEMLSSSRDHRHRCCLVMTCVTQIRPDNACAVVSPEGRVSSSWRGRGSLKTTPATSTIVRFLALQHHVFFYGLFYGSQLRCNVVSRRCGYQYPPYEEQFLNQQQGLSIGMTKLTLCHHRHVIKRKCKRLAAVGNRTQDLRRQSSATEL